jgi:hypothetical protein
VQTNYNLWLNQLETITLEMIIQCLRNENQGIPLLVYHLPAESHYSIFNDIWRGCTTNND